MSESRWRQREVCQIFLGGNWLKKRKWWMAKKGESERDGEVRKKKNKAKNSMQFGKECCEKQANRK